MKTFDALHSLLLVCLVWLSAIASAAPTFIVSQGVLTEAKNVNVEGTLYDVTFGLGSCNQVFSGCVESAFTFHTQETAMAAGQALLDQLYVDSTAATFGSWPGTVPGCNTWDYCLSYVPYGYRVSETWAYGEIFTFARAFHFMSDRLPDFVDGDIGYYPHVYITGDYSNFAIFTLAAEQPGPEGTIPEPSSMALIALTLISMAALNRRRR